MIESVLLWTIALAMEMKVNTLLRAAMMGVFVFGVFHSVNSRLNSKRILPGIILLCANVQSQRYNHYRSC